jgi:hypothetical protein
MTNDQLVAKSLLVLDTFCAQNGETGRSKSELLRATGSKDKPTIFRTIDFMKRANILKFKSLKRGKKESITLTPLGLEVVEVVALIKHSNYTYNQLRDKIQEYLPLMRIYLDKYADKDEEDRHRNSIKEKLAQKGWNREQIASFIFEAFSLLRAGEIYHKDVCNSLLYRYSKILSSFQVNKSAKEIIIKIIVNVITNILKNDLNIIGCRLPQFDHNLSYFSTQVLNDIDKFYSIHAAPNCFISDEIAGLMSSLVLLLKPHPQDFSIFAGIYSKIEHDKNHIDSIGNKQETYMDITARHSLKNLEEVVKVIEPYERKYGSIPILHGPTQTLDVVSALINNMKKLTI